MRGIILILPGLFCALQLLLKIKSKNKTKAKNQNVNSSSCTPFLFDGDSAEKSLRLKSFHAMYAKSAIKAASLYCPGPIARRKSLFLGQFGHQIANFLTLE